MINKKRSLCKRCKVKPRGYNHHMYCDDCWEEVRDIKANKLFSMKKIK